MGLREDMKLLAESHERTSANRKQYPEHEKLRKVSGESQNIGAFLDWLTSESEWQSESAELPRITEILAAYFEIDEGKLEEEKRAMIEECVRKANKG